MSQFKAHYEKKIFQFKKPAGTSRGILQQKVSWFFYIEDKCSCRKGIGEVSVLPGLSIDLQYNIEQQLDELCLQVSLAKDLRDIEIPSNFPAIKFAIETALLDLANPEPNILFNNNFSEGKTGIAINGLVWMNTAKSMFEEAIQKYNSGFKCLKFKVGALNFDEELNLLYKIRNKFGSSLEIRLDANGAFSTEEAYRKLLKLSEFQIHSIEQPIKAGQWKQMQELCKTSPIPIALDEELIGIENKSKLLEEIQPQYIILKPSLIGGLAEADKWIHETEKRKIGWWATSALESNIGLNAIAQWVSEKNSILPQGLGTGGLFEENIPLPLEVKNGFLWYRKIAEINLFNL